MINEAINHDHKVLYRDINKPKPNDATSYRNITIWILGTFIVRADYCRCQKSGIIFFIFIYFFISFIGSDMYYLSFKQTVTLSSFIPGLIFDPIWSFFLLFFIFYPLAHLSPIKPQLITRGVWTSACCIWVIYVNCANRQTIKRQFCSLGLLATASGVEDTVNKDSILIPFLFTLKEIRMIVCTVPTDRCIPFRKLATSFSRIRCSTFWMFTGMTAVGSEPP